MRAGRIVLAPGLPGIAALGASRFEDLLGIGGALSEEARGRLVHGDEESVLLRVPLPGTPDESDPSARLTSRPRGAGTGFVYVRRYHAARPGRLFESRFTPPRSESLAAREWNLLCHLRRQGIGTPEPLAVGGERAAFFARRSFLVTRELTATLPVEAWLAEHRTLEHRRRAARAVGNLCARLHRARVDLPRLVPDHVHLAEESADRASLALAGVSTAHGCGSLPAEGVGAGMRWKRSVEAMIASVRGGRLLRGASLASLERTLAVLSAAAAARPFFDPGEQARVVLVATRGVLDRPARRALLERVRSTHRR